MSTHATLIAKERRKTSVHTRIGKLLAEENGDAFTVCGPRIVCGVGVPTRVIVTSLVQEKREICDLLTTRSMAQPKQ